MHLASGAAQPSRITTPLVSTCVSPDALPRSFRHLGKGDGRNPFYNGKFFKVPEPVGLRPRPSGKPSDFYRAIGSPPTAEIMDEIGLPPVVAGGFRGYMMGQIIDDGLHGTTNRVPYTAHRLIVRICQRMDTWRMNCKATRDLIYAGLGMQSHRTRSSTTTNPV